jgi:cytochrome c-type biogenesis protein
MDVSQGLLLSAIFSAVFWGIASFASPCILPLIPSYVSYITGISFDELVDRGSRRKNMAITLFHSVAFVAGFSLVFVLLGATASLVGQALAEYQDAIRIGGGVLIILFGFFVMDVVPIPFLQRDAKLHLKSRPAGYLGTVLVGVIFGAGWTPCTGPFLAAVLTQASQAETVGRGMALLAFYSLGLGIPFILSALALGVFLSTFKRLKDHMRAIKITSGTVLILMGLLLVTNKMTRITTYTLDLWEHMRGLW